MQKANAEGWTKERGEIRSKTEEKTKQKIIASVSDKAAENAAKKERIRSGLLDIVDRLVTNYPQNGGTSVGQKGRKNTGGGNTNETSYELKLTDLSRIYRDIADIDTKMEQLEIDRKLLEEKGKFNDDSFGDILEKIRKGE
jgi:hypothetical protein